MVKEKNDLLSIQEWVDSIRVIIKIQVEDVVPDTAQPRQDWETNKNKLDSLAEDIQKNGLYYPIIVSPFYVNKDNDAVLGKRVLKHKDRKWWLLDGERRLRCYKKLGLRQIDAIVRTELTLLEMMQIQFASNTKRLQVSVREMSIAIGRYRGCYANENEGYKEVDLIKSLCSLTGFSASYFDSAEAINRADEDMKVKVLSEEIGGYAPREIEKATKDEHFRRGLTDAYVNAEKPISALAPRALKYDLSVVEKEEDLEPNDKRLLANQMMTDFTNQGEEKKDDNSNFLLYQQKANKFRRVIRSWNLMGLKPAEIGGLVRIIEDIYSYFKEERRLNNQVFSNNNSGNISGKS